MSEVESGISKGGQVLLGRIARGKERVVVFEGGLLGSGWEKALGIAEVLDQLKYVQAAAVLGDGRFLVIEPDFMGLVLEGKHFTHYRVQDLAACCEWFVS